MLLASLTQAAYAVKLKSVYVSEVPVVSQDEKLRDKAIQQAFGQTLIKLTGDALILKNPQLKAALATAKNNVDEFGYLPSATPGLPFTLKVEFDSHAIRQLLNKANVPLWGLERPLILVWLSAENANHTAELVDSESNNEWAVSLKQGADQRGLPLFLPMLDITDIKQVSAADIRAMSVATLQKAAERYKADGILIGSIEQKDKLYISHWKLTLGEDQWDWNFINESPAQLLQVMMDKMTATLTGRDREVADAAPTSPTLPASSSASITLTVKGVNQRDDVEDLMHFLKDMPQVKELEMENVLGDEVELHLTLQCSQKIFMQDVGVGKHLQLQAESENNLTYVWVR